MPEPTATARTQPRTWTAEASVEHERRVGHLIQEAASVDSLSRLIAVRDLMRETADRIQESIDLAAAELLDGRLTLTQIADGTGEARSTVQGYAERGRRLV